MDIAPELEPAHRTGPLARQLKQARDRLIQTGTRNRLVHCARFTKRGKTIDIVDERSDDVFRILVRAGTRMRFDHDPAAEEEAEDGEPRLFASGRQRGEERFTDTLLQTPFGQDKLQKKLLSLTREAKTLEEEQGVNALYIALGFLRWFEDEKSEVVRQAPLVLVPVSLRRNERTSSYELEFRGEDITTNEPLQHRLADDFGIKLPEIDEGEEWLPSDYFAAVNESISGKARWTIDADGLQLGFFSFAKLLMVRDLDAANWPKAEILDHPIIGGLLSDGFEEQSSDFDEGARLDELFAPADLVQVVDADASQTLVIESVRKGRNLVVMGPPGTGKSQTITNIIASAVHDGRSVLFVAEKMAALNVVHSRLVQAGLRDVCLELHSRSANKQLVAQELGRTLNAAGTWSADDDDASELQRLRDTLNGLSSAMHGPIGKTDITPYRAVSTLVRLREHGFMPADVAITGVETWSRKDLAGALEVADVLSELTSRAGPRDAHPFLGVRRTDLLPTDVERLQARLSSLVGAVDDAGKATSVVARSIGVSQPASPRIAGEVSGVLDHIAQLSADAAPFAAGLAGYGGFDRARSLAEAGLAFQKIAADAQTRFRPAALASRTEHLRPMLATGHSFFGRLGSAYRTGSSELQSLLLHPLPKGQPERMKLLDDLMEWQRAAHRLEQQNAAGRELLGDLWRGADTDFRALSEAAGWMVSLLRLAVGLNAAQAVQLRRHEPEKLRAVGRRVATETAEVRSRAAEIIATLDLDIQAAFGVPEADAIPFDALAARLRLWLVNMQRLDEWSQLLAAHQRLSSIVGTALPSAVAVGGIPPDKVAATIRYVHAETLYRLFAADKPWATRMTAEEKAAIVGAFREREQRRRATISRVIRGQHAEKMPRGGMGAMGFIRGEIARRRGHKPIRVVMKSAGPVVQQIKPVFLMSPISVAQYLPPGSLDFDLLVIDEASQVRPEEALGAIARARQVVVVGDRKQLPPTSFFDRMVADEADDDERDEVEMNAVVPVTSATEMESILTLCEARGLSTRMLEWHYRSRHPSLIEVSNAHFYDGRLVLFPAPSAGKGADGLKVRRVDGAYDRGGKRHNVIEAEAVARAVATHARNHPERTLGVVTFSTAQRDQVTYWLDKLRQDDEALDEFMREGRNEEFFVKNIENVQGDERDVVFISVGYGPRVAGQRLDSMAFGPVSAEGGERRLNVLFTRARFKTEVFVSFDSGDIHLSRTRSDGARVFKHFLQAAETGQINQPRVLDDDPDSDFEVSVANAIRVLGYAVDHQVGSAGFRIDLAVRDPGRADRYMLAIECDGATYHSAVWARERDRQRQEVLEGLGWRFHRVWSTDWFHRRAEEFRRLEGAIEAARTAPPPAAAMPEPAADHDEPDDAPPAEAAAGDLPDYEVADFEVQAPEEPHLVPVAKMADIVERIVTIEGPVHQEEIARRVAALFGKQKAGSRIAERVEAGLRYLASRNGEIRPSNGFWLTKVQQSKMPLRNRSRAPLSLRRANLIPPMEIEVAIKRVLDENGALERAVIPRAVALLFGFQRTGQEFRPAVEPVVDALFDTGSIVESSAGVIWNNPPA